MFTILLIKMPLERDSVRLHLVEHDIAVLGADGDLGLGFVARCAPYGTADGEYELFGGETSQIVHDNESVLAAREQLRPTPEHYFHVCVRFGRNYLFDRNIY